MRGPAADFLWGIERETHRILIDGRLSREGHPAALAQPDFTTDFAESQLELVTRPRSSIGEVMGELKALTRFASRSIGGELLWPFSMPPILPQNDEIRLAHPGQGEAARSAERYRNGLSLRYGAERQMICGVHVNVSIKPALLSYLASSAPLSDEESKERTLSDAYYLRLVRNLVDDLPFLVFFFGASPVREGRDEPAVSLRNSPLGYARSEYRPFFDLSSIAAHVAGIRRGLATESDAFRRLGLVRGGRVIQLNNRVFQKEREFYAPIRFRAVPGPGESPLTALDRRGVEYVELRFFDVDPFSPSGVSEDGLKLLHLLLLDALGRASFPRSQAEWIERLAHADEAALRDPTAIDPADPLLRSASARLGSLEPLAAALDANGEASTYGRALALYRRQVAEPGRGTAARLYESYRSSGLSWTEYGAKLAAEYSGGGING